MEWSDTLMFDAVADCPVGASGSVEKQIRKIELPGVTLLCAKNMSRIESAGALKLLRGFRATGRRVVLCDTTHMAVGRQLGREAVESGAAQMLISCGISGREVGIGARDAGLDLSSVVVCSNPLSGGQVLVNQLRYDDTVLLLGVDDETCDEIALLLEHRFAQKPALAA